MKRTNSRIKAMMKLYAREINQGILPDDIDEEIIEEIGECDEDFSEKLYFGVLTSIDSIDEIISNCLTDYKIHRLNYIDRQLIRIGTYELKEGLNPKTIVINEIVELSKKYTEIDDFKSSKFNNSLLDKIAAYLEK